MSVSREGIPGRLELETSQLRASSSERDADPDMLQRAPRLRMQALRIAATTAPQQPCHAPTLVSGTTGASFGGNRDCGLPFVRSSDLVRAGQSVFLIINTFRLTSQSCELEIWKHLQGKTKCFIFLLKIPVCWIKVWGLRRQICSIGRKRVLGTPWVWHCEGLIDGCCESSVILPRCQDYLSILGIDATNRLG